MCGPCTAVARLQKQPTGKTCMPLGMPAPAVALQRIPPVCFPLIAFVFAPRLAFFPASVPQRGCLLPSHHLASLLFPIRCLSLGGLQ